MTRRLHLGCGDDRLEGYVNADVRATPATDLVIDLETPELEPGAYDLLFSNAFFEHLRRDRRLGHLRAAAAGLDPATGMLCYIGVPYFREVARAYLDEDEGTAGPRFDLWNAYRYTHGAPEGVDWWHEQLHKSLSDADEIGALLGDAGFRSFAAFAYGYPGDFKELPVTMGFAATLAPVPGDVLLDRLGEVLAEFDGRRLRLETLRVLLVVEDGTVVHHDEYVSPAAHAARGARAAEAGDLDTAEAELRRAVDVESLNDLAVVAFHRGDRATARALLDACLALAPDHEAARENRDALDAPPA